MGTVLSMSLGNDALRSIALDVLVPQIEARKIALVLNKNLDENVHRTSQNENEPTSFTEILKTQVKRELSLEPEIVEEDTSALSKAIVITKEPKSILSETSAVGESVPKQPEPSTSSKPKSVGKCMSRISAGKVTKVKTSREALEEAFGKSGIVKNLNRVKMEAWIKIKPEAIVKFTYNYDPTTGVESITSDSGRDKLNKLKLTKFNPEIVVDKNGNVDATQFCKWLPKLLNKYEGSVTVNGIQVTSDRNPSRRLKILSIDIKTDPMIIQICSKRINGVTTRKGSKSKLDVRGETEFGGDNDKWIRFQGLEGRTPNEISVITTPEAKGKGKIFVCIPAAAAVVENV